MARLVAVLVCVIGEIVLALWLDIIPGLEQALPGLAGMTPNVTLGVIVAGLGLSFGRGLVGMVVAEFLMSISGLGALSQDYTGELELDKGLAPVVLLMIAGIILTKLVNVCEGRFSSWRTRREA